MLLFPEVGTNVAGHAGSPEHDDALFDGCDVVVSQTLVSQRMAACPLEVRSAAAEVGRGRPDHRLALHAGAAPGSDGHRRHARASTRRELRIIAPDVGGGFGAKSAFGAEEALVVWLARHLGTPVRWTESRSESMVALPHGRGQRLELTLGGTRDGKVLAYRIDILQDAGAYPGVGAFLPNLTGLLSSGVYAIPRIEVEGRAVVTNTTPMTTFRGAGQARGIAGDRAHDRPLRGRDRDGSGRGEAQELHLEGRVPAHRPPPARRTTPATTRARSTSRCAPSATTSCAPSRSGAGSRAATIELGIGISSYTEITNPLGEAEFGEVEITADGGAIVRTGSFSHGQGHETTFAMIAAERLGLPDREGRRRQGRHRRRSQGHRHVRLEVDADRRHGRHGSRPTRSSSRRRSSPPTSSRRAPPTSCSTPASAASTSPGRPTPALSWAELASRAAADGRLGGAEGRHRSSRRRRPSRSARTSPSSRWTSRPGGSS